MPNHRRHSSYMLLTILALLCPILRAKSQDVLPTTIRVHKHLSCPTERMMRTTMPLIPVVVGSSMPECFRDTIPNCLTDSHELYPFFDSLVRGERPVRILHIGDSHVRGHVFTVQTRHALEKVWGSDAVQPDSINYRTSALAVETGTPGLVYHAMGVNGATATRFTQPDMLSQMVELNPDLVILSFGTNESHGRNYKTDEHWLQMDSLTTAIQTQLPQAKILMTTPPGSYIRKSRRGKRVINTKTREVVQNILDFAHQKKYPVWDMYNIVGGQRACQNWVASGYMQRDRIHYTHNGYILQGQLLAEAMIKAFNEYVADRLE